MLPYLALNQTDLLNVLTNCLEFDSLTIHNSYIRATLELVECGADKRSVHAQHSSELTLRQKKNGASLGGALR